MSNFTKYLVLIVCFFSASISYGQINGDYRSKTGTNLAWNTATNWEIYDASLLPGNPWKATTQWPGQTAFTSPASNTVTIQSGSAVNTVVALTANTIPNLVINGTLTANFNGGVTATAVTVASGGVLTVSSSTTTLNFTTYNVAGTHNGAGNTVFNTGNLNVSGLFRPTGTVTFNTGSSLNTSGTFNPLGACTFAANSVIGGAGSIVFGSSVTINNDIIVTNQTTITISGNLVGSNANSEFINSLGSSVLNYMGAGAPMATGKLTATVIGNTINYSGDRDQTIKSAIYYNLK